MKDKIAMIGILVLVLLTVSAVSVFLRDVYCRTNRDNIEFELEMKKKYPDNGKPLMIEIKDTGRYYIPATSETYLWR